MDGKTVIVVGAGKGTTLGSGVAAAFARAGANVAIVGRGHARLARLATEIATPGAQVLSLFADSFAGSDASTLVEAAVGRFGRVDVLVNAMQASASGAPLSDMDEDDLLDAVRNGPAAALAFMKACRPHLKATHGLVVNFVSYVGLAGQPGQGALAAAREGLRALGRVAAAEWECDHIRVASVAALAWTSQLSAWRREFPDTFESVLAEVPGGRFADVRDEVGELCVRLATEDLPVASGATYLVDGSGASVLEPLAATPVRPQAS